MSTTTTTPPSTLPRTVVAAIDTVLSALDKTKAESAQFMTEETTGDSVARDLALAVAISGSYLVLKRAQGEDISDSPVLVDFERSRRAFERVTKKNATKPSHRNDKKPSRHEEDEQQQQHDDDDHEEQKPTHINNDNTEDRHTKKKRRTESPEKDNHSKKHGKNKR